MGFWFAFIWWLITSVASALLFKPKIENARPSGLDDFQVPTATEGRVIPIIVGKVKMGGPNVVWYGDLVTEAITEKVGSFLGIGGKKITKGFKYKLGVQMAVSRGPIDGHDRVWFGDKIIKSGESSGSIVFTDDEYFGGESSGGGVDFTIEFAPGSTTQAVNSYLAQQYTPTPAYLSTAYFTMSDGSGGPAYIGNAGSLRNFAFELFWYPNSLGVAGGKERIGDDANPICFLFEILVNNDDWGLEMSISDVLLTGTVEEGALIPVAEQIFDEGLGFSMVIDRALEGKELISEIERHIDGVFRLDLTDGKFKVILARPPTGPVPLLDESNIIEMKNFFRGNWSSTKNELRIGYADRAKEYASTYALDQDLANREIVGQRNTANLNFPGCKTAVVANILVARELATFIFPLSKITLSVTRDQYKIQRGDPFNFTWPDEGIFNLAMRVIKVRYGTDRAGTITIDAVEDIFRLETAGFIAPPPTDWEPPSFDAINPLDARIWLPPAQLQAQVTTDPALVMLVARDGGLHLQYDIYTDFDGGGELADMVLTSEENSDWTPVATLNGGMVADLDGPPHYTQTVAIDGLSDIEVTTLDDNGNDTVLGSAPSNVFLIDDELMWYESIVDNGGGLVDLVLVHRGAFGTIPADHADNARIWFPTLGGALLQPDTGTITGFSGIIRCRVTPRTATGTLDLASANNIPLAADFSVPQTSAYAPRDPIVNTEKFVDQDWTATPGVLRVSWFDSNRFQQSFDTKQDDPAESLPSNTAVRARVRRVDTDAIVLSADDAVTGTFDASDFLIVTVPGEVLDQGGALGPGGTIAELDHYVEVQAAISGGLLSQQWRTTDFEVFGFGLDFGSNFGGQDTGGPNLGTVLDQGAAPLVIVPTPPSEIADRLYQIIVAGADPLTDFSSSTFVRISGFDATQQTSYVFQDTMEHDVEAQTLEEIAIFIENMAVTGYAFNDRPFTVTRLGTTIEIRGTQGSNVKFETRAQQFNTTVAIRSLNPPGNVEEALGSQTGVRGAYFDDWHRTILDPVSGLTTEALAPTSSSNYSNATPSAINNTLLTFFALTREAEALLNEIPWTPGTGISTGKGVVAQYITFFTGINDNYDSPFSDIVGRMQDSPVGHLADYFVGQIPGGTQTRNAIAIQAAQDLSMQITFHDGRQEFPNNPGADPFQLRVKESIAPVIEGPLAQSTAFSWTTDESGGRARAGVIFQVIINGTVFSSPVVGAPGEDDECVTAVKALVATINGGSEPVSAVYEPFFSNARLVVTHDTEGAASTFDAQIYAGRNLNRIEFRILDE
jgi:hypothetical protein